MNEQQKAIIRVMNKHSIGAIFVQDVEINNGWIFPRHIRNNWEICEKVIVAMVARGIW
jgi:hypothetical protein